jgi:hypothetical protein
MPVYRVVLSIMINLLHLTAYERDLKIRNRSPRTAQNYRQPLLQLSEYVDGADLLELSRTEVEGYGLHVLESRSASSAAGRYRALRAFYNRPWTSSHLSPGSYRLPHGRSMAVRETGTPSHRQGGPLDRG